MSVTGQTVDPGDVLYPYVSPADSAGRSVYSVRWLVNGVEKSSDNVYTVSGYDAGKTITVEADGIRTMGYTGTVTSPATGTVSSRLDMTATDPGQAPVVVDPSAAYYTADGSQVQVDSGSVVSLSIALSDGEIPSEIGGQLDIAVGEQTASSTKIAVDVRLLMTFTEGEETTQTEIHPVGDTAVTLTKSQLGLPAEADLNGYTFQITHTNVLGVQETLTHADISVVEAAGQQAIRFTLNGLGRIYIGYVAPITVTFDTQGGSAVAAQTVKLGDLVQLPADPIRAGYIFAGWDVDLTAPILADCTVTAKWVQGTTVPEDRVTVTPDSAAAALPQAEFQGGVWLATFSAGNDYGAGQSYIVQIAPVAGGTQYAIADTAQAALEAQAAEASGSARFSVPAVDEAGRPIPGVTTQYIKWLDAGGTLLALESVTLEIRAPEPGLESLALDSAMSWSGARNFGAGDYAVARPLTGFAEGYYIVDNEDGTVSGVIVPTSGQAGGVFTVERYNAQGAVTATKTLSMELPVLGTVFSGATYNYVAFGQMNAALEDSLEVWRIVQYDKDWNRLGAVSLTGGETYTKEPFRSAVPRMAESADGQTVALYAARNRYDGHQSNITFVMNAQPFSLQTCMGEEFPSNHVSHSFGEFVQFDGDQMVTVDHGDAYPRSFVLQVGGKELDLLKIYGATGDNVTNAIGSGFEVSDSGYLFLGCSDPQDGVQGQPWNVFLAYTDKTADSVSLTWLTDSSQTINCARLVKLDGNTFAAMWNDGGDLHLQLLNGQGQRVGTEQVFPGIPMPPTQPLVQRGSIRWIQADESGDPYLYTLTIG